MQTTSIIIKQLLNNVSHSYAHQAKKGFLNDNPCDYREHVIPYRWLAGSHTLWLSRTEGLHFPGEVTTTDNLEMATGCASLLLSSWEAILAGEVARKNRKWRSNVSTGVEEGSVEGV